jgi:hypothetical protein
MTKHYLFFSLLALSTASRAQFIERDVLAAQGSVVTNQQANLSLSSTIGESIVLTRSNAGFILTEGFQQPNDGIIASLPQWGNETVSIHCWPNPFVETFNLKIQPSQSADFKLSVNDMAGRKIREDQIVSVTPSGADFNFYGDDLRAGIYLVTVQEVQSQRITTLRITKTQ